MTENIHINKTLNFFVFLGEFSDARENPWHKERKAEWVQIGKTSLTRKEKHSLTLFRHVFDSIPYEYIESFFILKNPFKNKALDKILGEKNKSILEESFKLFESRFEKVWKTKEKNLAQLKKKLNDSEKRNKLNYYRLKPIGCRRCYAKAHLLL